MNNCFFEALDRSPEIGPLENKAIKDLFNTIYGDETPDATLVDNATEEPPTLAEFENLGEHEGDDISVTEQGLKMTQTLPDGTYVTTIK